jgi:hypothetical protein
VTDEADISCARCGTDLANTDFWQLSARRSGLDVFEASERPTDLCGPCKDELDQFLKSPTGADR